MTKKWVAKKELEETGRRTLTSDDCPTCKQHFSCDLAREAHMKRYPSHFGNSKSTSEDKAEAATCDLKPREYKAKPQ
jgi:hypothetical protein